MIPKKLAKLRDALVIEHGAIHDPGKEEVYAKVDFKMGFDAGVEAVLKSEELKLILKTLSLIEGMAGNPNASDGCRNIIVASKSVRKTWNNFIGGEE